MKHSKHYTMNNQIALQRFHRFSRNYQEIFHDNEGIRHIINSYRLLRANLGAFSNGVEPHYGRFVAFYGMRFCSVLYKNEFFSRLRNYYEQGIPTGTTPFSFTTDLEPLDGFQFVFSTKLFSLLKEDTYPIIDKNVRKAFGWERYSYREHGTEMLEIIKATYQSLFKDEMFIRFKTEYGCDDIADLRIMDFIFLLIGRAI